VNRRDFSALLLSGAAATKATVPDRARRASIAATQRAFIAERKAIGKGDYRKWYDSLAELRKELRAVMDWEAASNLRASPTDPNSKQALLKAAGNPPLFSEIYAGGYVALKDVDPFAWAATLRAPQAVQATSLWLKKQGIDLIFVPVPKMSDVYMDRIVPRGVPQDRIVSPHLRKVLFDLVEKDIEVVDLLPDMLQARDQAKYPLFFPADSHWSPTGRALCVQALAERLGRYPFVQDARKQEPLFNSSIEKFQNPMWALPLLTAEEKAEVEPFLHPDFEYVSRRNGAAYGNFESGPVMLIGDSFSDLIGPQLARAINLPVAMYPVPGGTIQPAKELLRNREVVAQAKVVIWVMNYAIFFLHDWPALPEVIRRELDLRKK
jgi:SGNH hydrolase-like domain, acetyltransferase AlgX